MAEKSGNTAAIAAARKEIENVDPAMSNPKLVDDILASAFGSKESPKQEMDVGALLDHLAGATETGALTPASNKELAKRMIERAGGREKLAQALEREMVFRTFLGSGINYLAHGEPVEIGPYKYTPGPAFRRPADTLVGPGGRTRSEVAGPWFSWHSMMAKDEARPIFKAQAKHLANMLNHVLSSE